MSSFVVGPASLLGGVVEERLRSNKTEQLRRIVMGEAHQDRLFRSRSSNEVALGSGTPSALRQEQRHGTAAGLRTKLLRIFAVGLVLSLIGLGGWLITIYFLTEYHLRQAKRAFGHQRYSEAWDHLNKANRFRPRSPEIHLWLARVARLRFDFPKADEFLRRYKELQGQTEEEQLERLMLRAQTGEAEKVYHQLWPYVEEERPEASLILQAMTYGLMD